MHRHGYQGRKLGRKRDRRRALLKGLATSLIEVGKIETTLPKAKELVPYAEVLITKAKAGSLHDRRQIISHVTTVAAAHKLVDEIAPKLSGRTSGHLRLTQTHTRIGDNAQMAEVGFIDDITPVIAPTATPAQKEAKE
jgi:large subunit ribosomal protein L17